MDTSELLKYLKIVMDLEQDKFVQVQTINQLNKSIENYNQQYNNNKLLNSKNQAKRIAESCDNVQVDESGKGLVYFISICMATSGIQIGQIIQAIFHEFVLSLAVGLISSIIISGIPIFIWKRVILKKRKEMAVAQINRGIRADEELSRNRQNMNNKISGIISKLQQEKQSFMKTYNLTNEALKKCYEVNIIPPKYRSMIPVCMFYDYISNGRTYSLKRNPEAFDEGAINMYEEEVFKQVIIGKFNEAIQELREIKNNQKVFYSQMLEAERKKQMILNSINDNISGLRKDVRQGFDIVQYQNEQRNRCLSYMTYVSRQWYSHNQY